MRIYKNKRGTSILTGTGDQWIQIAGNRKLNPALTVRKLKSRKNTYRIWVSKNFTGSIFVI